MAEDRAVELRHEGRTYRAANREVFFRWAREHRISSDDSYRVAGTEKWIPVTANSELGALLDPENWWKLKMGGKTYVAPDWETIVQWAHEGRLSSEVQVEGPKTPPGGILGKASPELSPYLREWDHDDPEKQPVRIRFDGRTFVPGDLETLRTWISESRVPMEAQVMLAGESWQSILECGHFTREIWPVEEPAPSSGKPPSAVHEAPAAGGTAAPGKAMGSNPDDSSGTEAEAAGSDEGTSGVSEGDRKLYRIATSYGEDYVFEDPEEVRELLRNKRIHRFDEIRHPALPGGVMFVSEFVREFLPGRRSAVIMGILAGLFGVAGAAAIVFQGQGSQWMLIGGIGSLVVALVLITRLIWKR
ncbi:MAG: hypothetical protein AVO35_07395 [Candidatus Aegiribacteria sp. MLS_C]|nr:MAG: hypothetical protein AVO35_07395 [Candidatus Aegiribacteria sp. MLS_C]